MESKSNSKRLNRFDITLLFSTFLTLSMIGFYEQVPYATWIAFGSAVALTAICKRIRRTRYKS